MAFDDGCHIRHATVANFDTVAVEYRVEFMVRWEAFIQELQKFFTYIGRNIVAKGGVKPRDITFRVSWYFGFGGLEN